MLTEEFLEILVKNQRYAAKRYVLFSAGVVTLGLIVFTTTSLIPSQLNQDWFKAVLTVGSGFVSSMSVFPLKEFVSRINNAKILEGLKPSVEKLEDNKLSVEEKKRIEGQCLSIVEKIGLG